MNIHIHLILILQSSRDHYGHSLHTRYWHVVFCLHPCRTLHRVPVIPRRKWVGTNRVFLGSNRSARHRALKHGGKGASLLWKGWVSKALSKFKGEGEDAQHEDLWTNTRLQRQKVHWSAQTVLHLEPLRKNGSSRGMSTWVDSRRPSSRHPHSPHESALDQRRRTAPEDQTGIATL